MSDAQAWLDERVKYATSEYEDGRMEYSEVMRAGFDSKEHRWSGPLKFIGGGVAAMEASRWASFQAIKREPASTEWPQ